MINKIRQCLLLVNSINSVLAISLLDACFSDFFVSRAATDEVELAGVCTMDPKPLVHEATGFCWFGGKSAGISLLLFVLRAFEDIGDLLGCWGMDIRIPCSELPELLGGTLGFPFDKAVLGDRLGGGGGLVLLVGRGMLMMAGYWNGITRNLHSGFVKASLNKASPLEENWVGKVYLLLAWKRELSLKIFSKYFRKNKLAVYN